LRRDDDAARLAGMRDRLSAALCRIDGVAESDSAFKDGPGFWVNGKEIAHFEGASAMDLRLTRAEIRARRAQLRADPRVTLRSSSSDWLTVEFVAATDEAFVLELAEIAAAAHRPAAGSAPLLPPTGGALARRRRFH
jgi:Family of unknown function (DUF5519)